MPSIGPAGGFGGFDVSASGLRAQRLRMEVAAANIANVETTRVDGTNEPFRRKLVVLEAAGASGPPVDGTDGNEVQVAGVVDDPSPFQLVHRPGHPDADANGNVSMPNVNLAMEMVDLATAARAYEANLSAVRTFKEMGEQALSIGRNA
jgi:flagellar basal-body rod protein FlgC